MHTSDAHPSRGFTLIEVLVVVGLVVLLASLSTGALKGLAQGNRLQKALIGISSALETARQTAIAESTYTWVGMDSSRDTKTNLQTVTVATFVSGDGTKGIGASPNEMRLLSRVDQYEGVRLSSGIPGGNKLDNGDRMPDLQASYLQRNSAFSPNSKDLPRHVQGTKKFDWVIVFTPRGEACFDDGTPRSGTDGASGDDLSLAEAIRVVVSPCAGRQTTPAEDRAAAVIQVNGISGQVDVYQPQP